jgi:hypothetical protein
MVMGVLTRHKLLKLLSTYRFELLIDRAAREPCLLVDKPFKGRCLDGEIFVVRTVTAGRV